MKRNITICFRTDTEIRNSLRKLAEDERRSLSSVIETIIYHHLKKKKGLYPHQEESHEASLRSDSISAVS